MAPDRVALISGGGTGIGRGLALALAAEGYRVAVAGRRIGPLQEVSDACGARPYTCDVGVETEVDLLLSSVIADFDRLDVVVNCAGIGRPDLVENLAIDDIDAVLRTNLIGTILVCRRSIEPLRQTRGCIVNVSSLLAQLPQPTISVYAATKGAMDAFSRVLALELAQDGIRVNVVSPAVVRSDFMVASGMDPDAYDSYLEARVADYPLGRIGEPEDVAAVVSFLASPAAQWLTGLTIPVDGGRLLGPSLASRATPKP
jgi:NAD(P)-dependent dehydrogenase (short-subunit alcohol dehydrogenase family)